MHADPDAVLRDPGRLDVLRSTELLDSPPEEAFDRLTRLAARVLRSTTACVSLLDDRRQFLKSVAGADLPVRELPLSDSFCRHTVGEAAPTVIPDSRADERVRGSRAVRRLGVLAYLGVPLVTPDGWALGTLCVTQDRPRAWTEEEVETLRDVASVVTAEVERRRLAADARRAEEALYAAETMFHGIVEQSLAGIYVVQRRRFSYVNPRLAEIFGYERDEVLALPSVLELVAPEDRPLVGRTVDARLAGELGTLRYGFRGLRRDGETIHVEVHGNTAEFAGEPAVIGVLLDVTDRVRAAREREEAMRARDRFYAMLSHELRTPISAVMLHNELLLEGMLGRLEEPQRDALDRSQRSAAHLLELINDLLDLSKLESGRMERRVEELDLVELAAGVVGELAPLADERGCPVALRVEERPFPLLGDGRRVRQILLNLLSNALKFGAGRPVEVRLLRAEDGGAVVEVEDRGPGIDPEDVGRIFDDFVQLGDGGAGTGLGLPIARRLAALLGGSLEVESEPGEGSVFRLRLPADPAAA